MTHPFCEDYPACGHNLTNNTCNPSNDTTEPWYCDICGYYHHSLTCPEI